MVHLDPYAIIIIGIQAITIVYFAGKFAEKVEGMDVRLTKVEDEHSACRMTMAQIKVKEGLDL
jgi:hypothetical protein